MTIDQPGSDKSAVLAKLFRVDWGVAQKSQHGVKAMFTRYRSFNTATVKHRYRLQGYVFIFSFLSTELSKHSYYF